MSCLASRVYNTQQLEVEVKVKARSILQHVAVSTWDKEAAFACVAIREFDFDRHDKTLNPAREPVSRELMRQATPLPPAELRGQRPDARRPNEFRRQANGGYRGRAVPGTSNFKLMVAARLYEHA